MSISSKSSESTADKAPQAPVTIERIVERIVERPLRRRLPDTRASITHRFNVAGHEGYLTVGLYVSGSPGELFITMSKEGSTIGGLMDCLGTAISVALQYGVPIESLVKKFEHQRFEPMGMTTSADIPFAKSLVDYIFRWLGMEFIPGYREANAPKRTRSTTQKKTTQAVGDAIRPGPELIGPPSNGSNEPASADSPNGPEGSTISVRARAQQRLLGRSDTIQRTLIESESSVAAVAGALDRSHAAMMGDAPPCDVCGSITVRSGNCYKCLNCGNSMGCS